MEIVYNPGARYDASVKAVIRISTIRKRGDGFSFNLRSSYLQSLNVDLRQQLNFNYRHNGWDLFGTLKYDRYAYLQDSEIKQTTHADTVWTQDNLLYYEGLITPVTATAGANYAFSTSHYAGFKYRVTTYPGSNESDSSTDSDVYADGLFYDRWNSLEKRTSHNHPTHWLNAYYNGSVGKLKIDFNSDLYSSNSSTVSHITETSQQYDNRTLSSVNDLESRLLASKLVL